MILLEIARKIDSSLSLSRNKKSRQLNHCDHAVSKENYIILFKLFYLSLVLHLVINYHDRENIFHKTQKIGENGPIRKIELYIRSFQSHFH